MDGLQQGLKSCAVGMLISGYRGCLLHVHHSVEEGRGYLLLELPDGIQKDVGRTANHSCLSLA
jgi:hypothetical protein